MTEVRIGHWTAPGGGTGCTVVVFPEGTTASGEVRGGAPATREFALLEPTAMVSHIDAVVLSGGSAFGLAAADGVVQGLVEADRGFATRSGKVPIVVAMSLFDLADGVPRPGATEGRSAFDAAKAGKTPGSAAGRVGAGAGATVGKWRGPESATPGGLGSATVRAGGCTVSALVAVNAVGDIDDGSTTAEVLAGTHAPYRSSTAAFENTTIGVIWTDALLNKTQCRLVAESGHDGIGRALVPAHTQADGDALVVASTGNVEVELITVRLLAVAAVEAAIRSVVKV